MISMLKSDRLTAWSMDLATGEHHALKIKYGKEATIQALDKLACYEDLGLDPEEIREVLERYNTMKILYKELESAVDKIKNNLGVK